MNRIIECVPNVSEGRDKEIIQKLSDAITSVSGIKLLHTDSGYDANRTVFTFAGPPEKVIESAYSLIQAATIHIDMSKQSGEHPRIGAVDVCPLIPVSDITLDEVKEYSYQLAARVGDELELPVYLYEYSARKPERKSLADIRRGGYENLETKLNQPLWKPDYGPSVFHPRFGAMVIGARNFLVAYNINLDTNDIALAKKIAGFLREKPSKWDNLIKSLNPEPGIGKLKGVKAIGWKMVNYGFCQVSVNITDIQSVSLFQVFNSVQTIAKMLKVSVTGSELIGMIPELMIQKSLNELGIDGSDRKNYRQIVSYLGLDSIKELNIEDRILELCINKRAF